MMTVEQRIKAIDMYELQETCTALSVQNISLSCSAGKWTCRMRSGLVDYAASDESLGGAVRKALRNVKRAQPRQRSELTP